MNRISHKYKSGTGQPKRPTCVYTKNNNNTSCSQAPPVKRPLSWSSLIHPHTSNDTRLQSIHFTECPQQPICHSLSISNMVKHQLVLYLLPAVFPMQKPWPVRDTKWSLEHSVTPPPPTNSLRPSPPKTNQHLPKQPKMHTSKKHQMLYLLLPLDSFD